MYHPTTRVLTVLELLQAHGRLSGADLAARLEVDGRSVRRYITMLQDLGIPVETERGRYGGYRLRRGFKLPPLMFTEEEALALTLGLLTARRLGLAAAAPAVEGALAKLDRVLPAQLREQVQAVQETLALDLAPPEAAPESAMVLAFSLAARQGRRLWLRYRSGAAETERELDPYGLVYHAGRWYTAGWCHLRADLRVFRLDRVLAVEAREATFARPADFDCLTYVLQALATQPGTWVAEAVLRLAPEEARRRVSAAIATLEETTDGVLLRCHTDNLDWMARYLVGLECPFLVRRPPELRAALRRLADDIAHVADTGVPPS